MLKTSFELLNDLAGRIKARRLALGFSQQAAAQRAGVAYRTWRRLENEGQASVDDLVKAAVALRCEEGFAELFPEPPAVSLDELLKRQTLGQSKPARSRAPRGRPSVRLAPGTPLEASLVFQDAQPRFPVGRLAMAGGLAQLEWSSATIAAQLPVSALLYPPEPGLHGARTREFDGLHGFLADSLPEGWGYLVMRRRLRQARGAH